MAKAALTNNKNKLIENKFEVTESIRSDKFTNLYSNSSKIGISPWDVTITFGQMVDVGQAKAAVEELVSIKFSPQNFKNLAITATEAIKQWESVFGEVHVGPGQRPNIEGIAGVFDAIRNVIKDNSEEK